MRSTDRLILVAVPLVALALGFWLFVLAPKQNKASDLQDQIDQAQSSISQSESQIAAAETARQDFPKNYSDLVTLGRAAPEDDDQATLVYDLAEMGKQNNVEFRNFEITQSSSTAVVPATTTSEPAAAGAPTTDTTGAVPADTTAPAPATEAAVAGLPLGAVVGPAGLPVTPYEFKFLGNFFDMADFFADLDANVRINDKTGMPEVRGRLMTIDAFALIGDPFTGFPNVEANFAVTTYIVPPEQGLAAGATPAGPAAVPTPVSTTSPTTTPPTTTPAPTP